MNFDTHVPGWMTTRDLSVLYRLASLVPENGSILEIGCFLGRSTMALYAGKKSSVSLTVVDTFQKHTGYDVDSNIFKERLNSENGSIYVDAFGDPELYKKAQELANASDSWLGGFRHCVGEEVYNSIYVNKIKFDDFDTSNAKYDLVFIDASHELQDVVNDIKRFIGNQDSLIVGDDFIYAQPGVVQGVSTARRANTWNKGAAKDISNKRMLLVPEDSKIWILVPIEGPWKSQFKDLSICFFN